MNITEAFLETVSDAHLREITRQRDLLIAQVISMRSFIDTVPAQIVSARLDAKEGKPTKYDYDLHAELCKIIIA